MGWLILPSENKCIICNGRGIVIKNNIAYRCSCVKQNLLLKKFKRANLAGILQRQNFKNFDYSFYPNIYCKETNCTYLQAAKKAFLAAQNFCTEIEKGNLHTRGLLFYGPIGTGKTFLASCIANRLLKKGVELLFAVVPDLLDTIKATYDAGNYTGDTETEILDGARNVPILILDDLGAHNYTDWTKNKIYSIINYRVNMNLPTVITTNEELEALDIYLGERTTSRISQLCKIYMLFAPADIRYIKSKQYKKTNT